MTVNDATTDAKTAAKRRVRAFLDARVAHAASMAPDRTTLNDEIIRQPGAVDFVTEVKGNPLRIFMGGGSPLLASDLAILAAED